MRRAGLTPIPALTESKSELLLPLFGSLVFHLFAAAQERLQASGFIPDVLATPFTAVGQRRVPDAIQTAVALQLVFILVYWKRTQPKTAV